VIERRWSMKGAHRREAIGGGGFETDGVGDSNGRRWAPALSAALEVEEGVRCGGKRAREAGGVGAHREGGCLWCLSRFLVKTMMLW
jgi:hypothetical protein